MRYVLPSVLSPTLASFSAISRAGYFRNLRFPLYFRLGMRTFGATTRDRDFEMVVDSEPEREELRRQARELKKRTKRPLHPVRVNADVIELSESDQDIPPFVPPVRKTRIISSSDVIEIIDTSSEFERNDHEAQHDVVDALNHTVAHGEQLDESLDFSHLPHPTDSSTTFFPSVGELLDQHTGSWRETAVPSTSSTQLPSQTGTISAPSQPSVAASSNPPLEPTTSDSSDSERPAHMNLAHFAYTAAASRMSSKASTSRSASSASTEPRAPAKKRGRTAAPPFADIPAAELERLLKCVCCDLAWTARKTTPQKIKHVQTCAKKHSMTHETVEILIRQELEAAPAVEANAKGKGKGKGAAGKEPDGPQTLLEDVIVADGRKKRRRPLVVGTVQGVQDVRGPILDRARLLIGAPASADANAIPASGWLDRQANWGMAPPTQVFGASGIGKNPNTSALQTSGIAFPPTQLYAPSKIVAAAPDGTATVSRTGGLAFPPTQVYAPSKPVHDTKATSAHEQQEKKEEPAAAKKLKAKKPRSTKAKAADVDVFNKLLELSDAELGAMLKKAILKDTALHHRILRYEPVDFEVFMQLVMKDVIPGRGLGTLKIRVHSFLDKQAIHFYGADVQGKR